MNSLTVIQWMLTNHSEKLAADIDVIRMTFDVVTPSTAKSAANDRGVEMTTHETWGATAEEVVTNET